VCEFHPKTNVYGESAKQLRSFHEVRKSAPVNNEPYTIKDQGSWCDIYDRFGTCVGQFSKSAKEAQSRKE
jgi:hypothetical protein